MLSIIAIVGQDSAQWNNGEEVCEHYNTVEPVVCIATVYS